MKTLLRELLWFGIALLTGVVVGFLFIYLIEAQAVAPKLTEDERKLQTYLYAVGCGLGIIGIYLARFMAWVLRR